MKSEVQTENPTLSILIDQAYSTTNTGNRFDTYKRAKEKERLLNAIHEKSTKEWELGQIDLNQRLSDIRIDRNDFVRNIKDFIKSKTNGKYQYALRFETLIEYMNEKYKAEVPTDFLKSFLIKDADRRRIELLKLFHSHASKPRNLAAYAEELGVDIKVLREDILRLERDFSFMDTDIKIQPFDIKSEIKSSSVHPVFLALNTTQVYCLLLILKEMARDSVLEVVAEDIADSIYSQLSDVGQELVSEIYPPDSFPEGFQRQFKGSDVYMRDSALQTILHAFTYQQNCAVSFYDGGEIKQIIGVPTIQPAGGNKTIIIKSNQDSCITILSDQVVDATEI